jgi:hypothetical protein
MLKNIHYGIEDKCSYKFLQKQVEKLPAFLGRIPKEVMDLVEFMGDISSTIIHDEEERL